MNQVISNVIDLETQGRQAQLITDLTNKLQTSEIRLATLIFESRSAIAENMIKTHIITGMALGLIPLPVLDMMALSGVQANLLRLLCNHYHVEFDEQLSKCIVSSMIRGALPVLTMLSLSSITKIIPGIGTLGGGISMALLVGATVYATGQVFVRHFETGGSLQDFHYKHWRLFFQQEFEEGKTFIKANRLKD
jgi:uncharacterized protein (DUF697 family)